MEKLLKIKSITDVITNSSTEVFQRYDESSFETIKELFNNILKLGGNNLTFDDLYEFTYDIDRDILMNKYEDYLIKNNQGEKAINYRDADYSKQYEMIEDEDYDIVVQLAKEYDERNYAEGYPAVRGYTVSLKRDIDIENKELAREVAKQLSNLDDIFESYSAYC